MAKRVTDEEVESLYAKHREFYKWMYPWNDWLDGGWWIIEKGIDYYTPTKSMRKLIHDKKVRWGGHIHTRLIAQDTILFRREPDASNPGTPTLCPPYSGGMG